MSFLKKLFGRGEDARRQRSTKVEMTVHPALGMDEDAIARAAVRALRIHGGRNV